METRPRIFFGSSSEGLGILNSLMLRVVESDWAIPQVWSNVLPGGKSFLQSVLDVAEMTDFAVLLHTPDDEILSRGVKQSIPRDNVIFETGAFIKQCGAIRAVIVAPSKLDLRYLSDLSGYKIFRYESTGNPEDDTRRVGEEIRQHFQKLWHEPQSLPEKSPLLTVVVGDRRERPPQTPGDCFAAAPSSRDLTWLPKLSLKQSTTIWNDKVCSAIGHSGQVPSYLRDRDLLIVVSPYCNLLARTVNKYACFPFHIPSITLDDLADLENPVLGLGKYDPAIVTHMQNISTDHDKLVGQLIGLGLVDIITNNFSVGVAHDPGENDYATVSICQHPYNKERTCLLVAGRRLPGTMAAVEMLCRSNLFERRPFGAIIRVQIPQGDWYERLTRAVAEFITPEYTVQEYTNKAGIASGRLKQLGLGFDLAATANMVQNGATVHGFLSAHKS